MHRFGIAEELDPAAKTPGPSVSVVIPTYQRRGLVRRAVASVLGQTFQDFELIVVDDGSTDGTGDALEGIDERIRYTRQENRGVAAARNVGIRLARGEIIAFLDSDDRWLPDHLAVLTEVLARHPEAVLCTTCPRFHVGGRQTADDGKPVDAVPLLFAENVDRPGMIGRIGSFLGEKDINISFMRVGREKVRGRALMVLGLDDQLDPATLAEIARIPNIFSARIARI